MKKSSILVGIMFVVAFLCSAGEQGVLLKYHSKSKTNNTTQVDRAPSYIPIEVIFNSDTNILQITGDDSTEAEVYLYDSNNTLEEYSSTVNVTFYISTPGIHVLIIQGEDWLASGKFEV